MNNCISGKKKKENLILKYQTALPPTITRTHGRKCAHTHTHTHTTLSLSELNATRYCCLLWWMAVRCSVLGNGHSTCLCVSRWQGCILAWFDRRGLIVQRVISKITQLSSNWNYGLEVIRPGKCAKMDRMLERLYTNTLCTCRPRQNNEICLMICLLRMVHKQFIRHFLSFPPPGTNCCCPCDNMIFGVFRI